MFLGYINLKKEIKKNRKKKKLFLKRARDFFIQ